MTSIIFETLLAEAEAKVKKLVKKGSSRKEATDKVAEDMDLTFNEVDELTNRIDALPVEELPEPADMNPTANTLNFKSPEEVEQAAGMLMFKQIPWRMKSTNPCFISFDSPQILTEARNTLKRRWDFLENENRTVASISFDNLDEYNKVVDFMRRQGFTVDADSSDMLGEDIMDELAANMPKGKAAKAHKFNEADICARNHVYAAVPKGFSKLGEESFNSTNRANRAVKVRKKWK